MREIKYQTFYGGIMHPWGFFKNSDDSSMFVPPIDFFAPQRQYTGLKDKNGKEIYEGDIITGLHVYDDEPFEVIYNFVSFRLRRGNGYFLNIEPQGKDFTLIGNIYENPELLSTNG
jgi:hypothetical protein